jgi:hypothetical protein
MEKMKFIRDGILFMLVLFAWSGASFAGPELLDRIDGRRSSQDDATYFQHGSPISHWQTSPFSEGNSSLDMGFFHKYLGYGTLLLAGVAAVTGSDSSTHHYSAVGSATLGAMTLATGYYEYGDMFEIDEGFSTSNLHIALSTLGAIGFATEAIIASTDSDHGALGIGSAAVMGGAFIVILW